MSDDVHIEPSLTEYARFHGLADNHLGEDLRRLFPSGLLSCSDTRLPEFELPKDERLPPEPKFRLSRKAACLLASSVKPPSAPSWSYTLPDHRRVQKLKVEQPILKSDHDSDMRKVRCRKPFKLEAINLVPMEMDEVEDEEGLACSPRIRELAAQWDKKIAAEKLQTTREVLKALQDALRPVYTPHMHEAIIGEELAFTKRPRLEPISPPLLASEVDEEPHIPSSPALRMQLLSDAPDPDVEQMHKAKQEFSSQNCIRTEDAPAAAVGHVQHLLRFAENGPEPGERSTFEMCPQSPIERKQLAKCLKLELPEVEPLTSPISGREPAARRVTFALAPVLENLLPDQLKCEEPNSDDLDQAFKEDLLTQLAGEAGQAVDKDLAKEKLEPADIVMRVEVPKLAAIKLTAPSTTITPELSLQTIVEKHLIHTRRSFDKVVERGMRWAPIPSGTQKLFIGEPNDPPPQFEEWTSQPPFAIRSEDLLWRPEILRILSISEDDEDELEADLSLKDEPPQETTPPLKRRSSQDLANTFLKRQHRPLSMPGAEVPAFGFGSLAGFMDTRKAYKKPRLESEATSSKKSQAKAASANGSEQKTVCKVHVPATQTQTPAIATAALIAPQLPKTTSPRSIIVNSRLLKSHRQLTQALETRPNPPLIIIYRDFETATDASEAPDIIISPTVAAIFTTLQATTQRSLPGQGPSHPPIFDRILHLSQLYDDDLFILTTLPPEATSPLESATTCSQISTLTSFCSSISHAHPHSTTAPVQPILIPTNPPCLKPTPDPSPLYTWTLPLLLKYAPNPITATTATTTTLLPEETLWELFLRKAGLNPYAAQVVLGMLKKPHDDDDGDGEGKEVGAAALWGLGAFVQMSREERVRRFAGLVGRRAVWRVSGVLDGRPWGVGGGDCG